MMRCNRCHEYIHNDKSCYCREFIIEDENGETHSIFAGTEYYAVKKYAQKTNENSDYYLIDNEIEIIVNGNRYAISAEPDIYYNVTELEKK